MQGAQFICLDPRKTKRTRIAAALGSGVAIRWIRFVPLSMGRWPEADKRAADALAMSKERGHGPIWRWSGHKLLWLQYCGARAMFAARPDAIAVCWNGLNGSRRVFMDGARDAGARTLYFELAPLPGRITADPCGVNFANGLPRDIAPYRAWLRDVPTPDWRAVGREIQQRRPTDASVDVGHLPPLTEPFLFAAPQTPGDSQLRLLGGAFPRVELFVDALIAAAKRLPSGWHLRVKEHPTANRSFTHLLANSGDLPIYFDNASDTFAQVKAARAVLTVNSSVGLEAMFLDKPVVACGQCFWAIDGVADRAETPAALADIAANPDSLSFDPSARDAFLGYLTSQYYPRLKGDYALIAARLNGPDDLGFWRCST